MRLAVSGSYFLYCINQSLVLCKLGNSLWNAVSPVEFSYAARNVYALIFQGFRHNKTAQDAASLAADECRTRFLHAQPSLA